MSVGLGDEKPRIFKRGGNRRTPGACSYYISQQQARRIATAVQSAVDIGLPFNRMTTIHWQRAGKTGTDAARATRQYIKYLRDWLNGRGSKLSYVWVRENDGAHGRTGDHVHILVHLPKGHKLVYQPRWIKAITGKRYRKGVSKTRSIGKSLAGALAVSADYLENLKIARDYVLKGVHPDTAKALGLTRYNQGGRVTGQRTGIWRKFYSAGNKKRADIVKESRPLAGRANLVSE